MLKTPAHTLRLVALTEGASFILLLAVAMPLKYWAGLPLAVAIVGWAHGILFAALALLVTLMLFKYRWPLSRAVLIMIAALLPFGPFIIDRRLKDYEHTS